MDNRRIEVVSEGGEGVALALELVWPNAPGGKATHYYIAKYSVKTDYYSREGTVTHHFSNMVEDEKGVPTLILLWHEEGRSIPLPFPLNLNSSIQFVQNWLNEVEYGREPDHDGSNGRGWRIFNESWGHVANHHYAIVAVQPTWAMYGK